jgi:hypothetical protein
VSSQPDAGGGVVAVVILPESAAKPSPAKPAARSPRRRADPALPDHQHDACRRGS